MFKSLSYVNQCFFSFAEDLPFVNKDGHKLLFPLLHNNEKKMQKIVFKELLKASAKSIRSITVPDIIYKDEEEEEKNNNNNF